MVSKPSNLIYGVDDKPGWGVSILLGFQHICLLSVAFIFPVVIVNEIGGTPDDARTLICMAMIATGVATALQGLNKGPVGSGYLCPTLNGPAFISASLLAGKTGGLSLIFGMTAFGGAFEALFSRVVSRLRALFPAEVTGTVVMMVGIEVIAIAIPKFFGVDKTHTSPDLTSFLLAFTTLFSMIGLTVWGKGKLRLYSVLAGLFIGYSAAAISGFLTAADVDRVLKASFFTVPKIGAYGLSFKAALLIPFLVAALSSALKTIGDLTTCQKINDAEWKRPEMQSISKGILACGIGNVLSGALGSLGQSVSSSNIGLSIATGAASRRIAYTTGAIMVGLAFFPALASVFVIMPTPIMGACLAYSVSFMVLAGIQIIMSRMLDARKTFVIGLSIIFGLSVDIVPQLYRDVHSWIMPIFSSSLSLATFCAVSLNLLFRINIAKTIRLELPPSSHSSEKIFTAMERQAGAWGARKEVIFKAVSAMNEFMELAAAKGLTNSTVIMDVKFDEFNLDVDIAYRGKPLELPEGPADKTALWRDPETAVDKLPVFLIRHYADKVAVKSEGDEHRVQLHFVH